MGNAFIVCGGLVWTLIGVLLGFGVAASHTPLDGVLVGGGWIAGCAALGLLMRGLVIRDDR